MIYKEIGTLTGHSVACGRYLFNGYVKHMLSIFKYVWTYAGQLRLCLRVWRGREGKA